MLIKHKQKNKNIHIQYISCSILIHYFLIFARSKNMFR